jgi:deoxyribonuclease V
LALFREFKYKSGTSTPSREFEWMNRDGREVLTQYDIAKWRAIQRGLAKKVIKQDCFSKPPKIVAGVDVAYSGDEAFSAVVLLDFENLELVETSTARSVVAVPYVPSFLFFREGEPMTEAIAKLNKMADVYLINAHGIAHPERCGCASQFGLTLDIATIGVAGEVLYGEVSESENGRTKYVKDGEEIIGAALLSKAVSKPIYVSVGHKVSLKSAIEIIQKTTKGNRMPEPLRLAHLASNEAKRKWNKEVTQENGTNSRWSK